MTIAFTGGGSGGHFYPLIAIAEALHDIVLEKRLVPPKLYYLAHEPYDEKTLFENSISYIYIPAGKLRRYFSIKNVTDSFLTCAGVFTALVVLFKLYPDVIVSKGGYPSVPVTLAARILRIPVIIHESDAKPGRANVLAARFAEKIAISYESAAAYFPTNVQDKIARTGIPIRKALTRIESEGARQYLGLEKDIPTILILGGSQGAKKINETVLSCLPALVTLGNVVHQTGQAHFKEVEAVAKVALDKNPHATRYHPINYLDQTSLQRVAGITDLVVSRAGSNTLAEIGLWKKPSIIIPIPESVSHDQRSNAYEYAKTGAAVVLEEANLTPHLLASETQKILGNADLKARMSTAASEFTDPDAARILATAVLAIALTHES